MNQAELLTRSTST